MRDGHDEIRAWLDGFASCVRRRDLAAGRAMFDAGCLAFGTRNAVLESLDALVDLQWEPTWFQTNGFRFDDGSIHIWVSPDLAHASAAALWSSHVDEDARRPPRCGRATFVFGRHDRWICLHSHLSGIPSGML